HAGRRRAGVHKRARERARHRLALRHLRLPCRGSGLADGGGGRGREAEGRGLGGLRVVVRRAAVRVSAPVVFLAAVTAVVLIARSALHGTPVTAAAAAPAHTSSAPTFEPPSRRAYYR